MTLDYEKLAESPRLLVEANLKPLQGDRFQPTGFADLGASRYTLADGTEMLLVESAQSVANRMELACCREDGRTLLDKLNGLPFVQGSHENQVLTTSYLESHRLSSPYLLNKEWADRLSGEMELRDDFKINDRKVKEVVFKYDPCSLIHGVWFALKDYKKQFSGGRVRIERALSGFVEASQVAIVESGGTKFDRNAARSEENANAETGYGTLPFPRTEYTAKSITAYFNLDLALLKGYGLPEEATKLLIALSLFKIQKFLSTGLRLRTACDLEAVGLVVKRPNEFIVPAEELLLNECENLIRECREADRFPDPPITSIAWQPPKKTKGSGDGNEESQQESTSSESDESE